MASPSKEEEEEYERRYKAPYTSHRPIPTIQKYNHEKEERQQRADAYTTPGDKSSKTEDDDAAKRYLWSAEHSPDATDADDDAAGRHESKREKLKEKIPIHTSHRGHTPPDKEQSPPDNDDNERQGPHTTQDTSEAPAHIGTQDTKQKRKNIKKSRGSRAEREVTDPVTHLPVRIHDLQSSDLKKVPENLAAPGFDFRTATGVAGKNKSDEELDNEAAEAAKYHQDVEHLFPPPEYDAVKHQLVGVYTTGIVVGLASMAVVGYLFLALERIFGGSSSLRIYLTGTSLALAGLAAVALIIWAIRTWMGNKIASIWEEELWHAQRHDSQTRYTRGHGDNDTQESTHWLNNILTAIWPLVNPDLFISLADTLEDVMQASLPSIVRMVSIEDIGQGSEAFRILGVRWLPTGAAARSVDSKGKLSEKDDDQGPNDRAVPGQGDVDKTAEDNEEQSGEDDSGNNVNEQQQSQIAEGMEAEEGDFINLEVAFSYRTRSSAQKFRERAKHAHLYIAFYLPGRIKLPVYVDLRGIVGIARVRLQITPDPPFFSLMTFTFLGQPKVDLACLPLTRKGLNVMDLPLISNFVQSAVDAAVAEYVAPKSLTLDLKDMLAGDDFKKDTVARGVIVCRIKRAFDFKQGDPAIPLIREGSADPYVTVGWAKFVKPLWSTRVILSEMEPHWEETAFILVTPDELNVDERLRVQLWDSDRMTADDDLGRIEMDIKEVMRSSETRGKMCDRVDGFKSLKAGEGMPGKLEWSVGYFPKTHINEEQLKNQTAEPEIRTKKQLEDRVNDTTERKLREAKKDESSEREQLRLQQYKDIEDRMVISAPPLHDYPSGLLAIQIHEATGLEVRALHNADRYNDEQENSDEEEQNDELPSAYCNIMLNHQKIYRTRVKPKNQKPFFNAGTERFIRDWRNTVVHIAVRDSRVHEDDPLMGMVRLPLCELFKDRSQVNNTYPLYGGVGYGRVRISLVFRSVDLQASPNMLGWDYGTLVIAPEITGTNIPKDLHGLRLKIQTTVSTSHMYGRNRSNTDEHLWTPSKDRKLHLAVKKRYSSPLIIQFRKDRHFLDKTAAFAVLWLTDLVDDKEDTITLPVWKGDLKRATTCYLRDNCGERCGEIKIKCTLYKGLDKWHEKLASKDHNLRDVLEVIETSRYASRQNKHEVGAITSVDEQPDLHSPDHDNNDVSSGDSSSDDSDGDDDKHRGKASSTRHAHAREKSKEESQELQEHGERDLGSTWAEYKSNHKQMHRRHRGIMQYKSARTMWWMKHKVEDVQDKIQGVFSHHERETGVETEA